MIERFASFLGIFVLLGIAFFFSTSRKRVPWRVVGVGIGLQVYLAIFIVRVDWVRYVLPVAALACIGALLARKRLEAMGERSLGAFAVLAARALGLLGVVAALVLTFHFEYVLLGFVATASFALLALRPSTRETFRTAAAMAGCVTIVLLLQGGVLPHDFAFRALEGLGKVVMWVVGFAQEGADFILGGLERGPFVFAIDVGAIILLFASLMSALYYVGVLPWIVGRLARLLHRALGVSGAESLAAAANVFIGQTEAPFVVQPYLARMTRSEINALMAGGYATIAGSVLGAYMSFLDGAGFSRGPADLIAASVMSAPASFVLAKLFVPETEESETRGGANLRREQVGTSFLDALSKGVSAGVKLAVNVIAMLLVFVALIKMLDASVGGIASWLGYPGVTFADLYSPLFAPFAWLIGVPADECVAVGRLLGTKTIFNEFLAYEDLGRMIEGRVISDRAAVLSTFALCGFANFMSIGIQIGGLSALAPERRADFVKLAFRAMIAGALACQLTACIVGLIGEF